MALASGEWLQLTSQGCEYQVLIVRYEFRGLKLLAGNPRAAYRAAALALEALQRAQPEGLSVFNLHLAAQVLQARAKASVKPEKGEVIAIQPNANPVPILTVQDWGRGPRGGYVVMELSWGPA